MDYAPLPAAPKTWDCDKCQQPIPCAKHGILEWTYDHERRLLKGFKIVHHAAYSPVKSAFRPNPCSFYDGRAALGDVSLQDLVGAAGLAYLLSWVDQGPFVDQVNRGPEVASLLEWTEIVRRLQLPFYEEARHYLDEANEEGGLADLDAARIYSPEFLAEVMSESDEWETEDDLDWENEESWDDGALP
jgi:hypothetical protein